MAKKLSRKFVANAANAGKLALLMNEKPNPEPDQKSPPLKWPRFALAAVILFFVLAIFWMSLAVGKLRQQRDVSAPLPASAPAH